MKTETMEKAILIFQCIAITVASLFYLIGMTLDAIYLVALAIYVKK
jgi:hypothetical protein|nr:MAG TPA: hypothetical protein [Crassvirales sp.]